jgi:hypothetical protein
MKATFEWSNDLGRLGSVRFASANLDVHQNVWVAGVIGGRKYS